MRLALLLLTATLPAQIRVTTRLVEVNVIVRDHNGPVRDLTLADFSLTDNGKPRPIVHFSANRLLADPIRPDPLPPGWHSNAPEHRGVPVGAATVVLLDGVNTRLVDQINARKEILAFLAQIQPQDRVAVYTLGRTSLRILNDFTGDPSRFSIPESIRLDETWNAFAQCEGESDLDRRVNLTVEALEAIAARVGGIAGRKNLVWVSASFPFALHNPRNPKTYSREINRAARALNTANVAIYPVDARGLVGLPLLSAESQFRPAASLIYTPIGQDTMDLLAQATGGRVFKNNNDIRHGIQSVLDDSAFTYTLAFQPDPSGLDGAFHNVRVKLSRPGLDVRHREGYVAVPDSPPSTDGRTRVLRAALATPVESAAIRARVQWQSDAVTLIMNAADVTLEGPLDVVFSQRAADGRELASATYNLRPGLDDARRREAFEKGLGFSAPLAPVSGAAELRVAVYDRRTGRIGTVVVPVVGGPK